MSSEEFIGGGRNRIRILRRLSVLQCLGAIHSQERGGNVSKVGHPQKMYNKGFERVYFRALIFMTCYDRTEEEIK